MCLVARLAPPTTSSPLSAPCSPGASQRSVAALSPLPIAPARPPGRPPGARPPRVRAALLTSQVRALDEGLPNVSINCWCGAIPDGSTILGGRAAAYSEQINSSPGDAPLPKPSVEQLVECSAASFAAAAAGRKSRAAARATELADEQLMSRGEVEAPTGSAGQPRISADLGPAIAADSRAGRAARAARAGASLATEPIARGASDAPPVWAEELEPSAGLQTFFTGRWLETESKARLEQAADVRCTVGELLTAMAHGEDALDERTGRSLQRAGRVIGPPGSPSHSLATRLRLDLLAMLGVERACALLRLVTRHGRLHPGLAPKVEGPTVNSEKGAVTPAHELRRMIESDGRAQSPFL